MSQDDNILMLIKGQLDELTRRVITTETIMETLVAQGTAQAQINAKQVEILEKLAAQVEINRSGSRRLEKIEKDMHDIRKDFEAGKVDNKLTAYKVSVVVTLLMAVAIASLKKMEVFI